MKDLKQLLADGDPVARERGLSDADSQAMRRTVVVEARRQGAAPSPMWSWPRPLALGAALALCLAAGVGIGVRLSDSVSSIATTRAVAPAVRADVRRQLQMTSPGGTRIIWTFHEDLEL